MNSKELLTIAVESDGGKMKYCRSWIMDYGIGFVRFRYHLKGNLRATSKHVHNFQLGGGCRVVFPFQHGAVNGNGVWFQLTGCALDYMCSLLTAS